MSVFGNKKHIPMGPDEKGRHPYHPERTNVTLPGPLDHSHSREFELDGSGKGNIARTSTVHKSSHVAIHAGMTTAPTYPGVSKAADSATALKGFFDPTQKAPAGKRLAPVETSFGMRSRTNFDELAGGEPGAAHARAQANKDSIRDMRHALGRRVLDEAYAVAGADHPENMRRAITAQQTLKDCK
jgi:hypothetical protein